MTRVICGMATGGIFPVGMAIIADAVAVDERQISIGRWLAVVIGGNLMASDVCCRWGVRHGGVRQRHDQLAAGGACQPAAMDVRLLPRGYLAIFTNPRANSCYLAVFLEGAAIFGLFPYVTLLLAMAGETVPRSPAWCSPGSPWSASPMRWRVSQLMIGGGLVALAALVLIAIDFAWPAQLAAFIVLGIGFYCLHGCIQVEASELSPTRRGAAMSRHSFFFAGQASGVVVYGIGFARLGSTVSVWLGGAAMALSGIMRARLLRRLAKA